MTAAVSPAKNLVDEMICSICLDYFQDPVMIVDCGHNFCRACITRCWKGSNVSCPQCRIRISWQNLRPNRHLGNIVEAAKQLSLELNRPRELMCANHKKALSLFCEKDRILLCSGCVRSRAHQGHSIVSTKEAATDYKMTLQRQLEHLKKIKNKIQSAKSNGGKPSHELLKEAQAKRKEIVSEFQQQVQFLKEEEQFHLARLEDMEREIKKTLQDYANVFDDEIVNINNLIRELEKKDAQPDDQFLEDIAKLFDRCAERNFQFPAAPDLSDAKKRLSRFSQESKTLQSNLRTFRETTKISKWIKENVLLDPETAHPRYIVSSDQKHVKWGDVRQTLPYSPKRFEFARCVLGEVGFTSGKHYWTVDVGDSDYWAVGVALESVERKEEIHFSPDNGVWAFGLYNDEYKALTSPPIVIEIDEDYDDPTEIQVSLNYDAGTVAFYDAEDETPLFIFAAVDFKGERVFPFFRIANSSSSLQLCTCTTERGGSHKGLRKIRECFFPCLRNAL